MRETIGAYQIKVDSNGHRAIFVGGTNYRDGNSTTQVDVNVGNYPLDVLDTDTNTGKSYASNQGIPNMTLKGNSFSRKITHTPVDVNGMTLHQRNYNNNLSYNGLNNPARWNVNADEYYNNLITTASTSL